MVITDVRTPERFGLALGAGSAALIIMAPGVGSIVLLATAGLAVGWVMWRDATSFTIPDGAVVALGLAACAMRLSGSDAWDDAALSLAADVALTGGALWLLREAYYRSRGHDGLGFGDVKLAAAAGCLVGAEGFAFALLGASVAGLAYALLRGSTAVDRIAFGVLLAPAVWVVLAAETVAPGRLFG